MSLVFPRYQSNVSASAPWLGDIPTSWRTRRGKFVFFEVNERSESGDETLLSVSEYYGVKPRAETLDEGEFLSRAESLEGYKKCAVDDLAMNIMLAWKRGLGVSKYAGIISPAYSVFRFRKTAVPDYMHYLLRTDSYVNHFKSRSTGIMDSRLRLYPDAFRDIQILLPSLNEQIQIARFLDFETAKIDRLIDKQRQLIALLKEKRQAVISHAVTKGLNPDAPMKDSGVEWLGEVPAHWAATRLKHHARVIDCKHVTAEFVDDGIPVASIAEVKGWAVDLSSAKKTTDRYYKILIDGERDPRPGDIIFTRNATVGEAALVLDGMPNFAIGQDVCVIRPLDSCLPEFVLHCLKSPLVSNQLDLAMIGSTFKRVNVEEIRNLLMTLPPVHEQIEIVEELDRRLPRYDALVNAAEKAVALMEERRTALISAAVTGKIDVRGWTPPEPVEEIEDAEEVA